VVLWCCVKKQAKKRIRNPPSPGAELNNHVMSGV
jgi:hypothetical protein